MSSGFVTATPVLAGGRTQTEADWVADQKGFLAAMKTAVAAKQLVFNGCQASANYPTWQPNSYSYLEHADGCSLEDWVVTGSGTAATPKTGSAWSVDVDLTSA